MAHSDFRPVGRQMYKVKRPTILLHRGTTMRHVSMYCEGKKRVTLVDQQKFEVMGLQTRDGYHPTLLVGTKDGRFMFEVDDEGIPFPPY